MSDGIIEEIAQEHDDVLDVHRLIEAVRGSRAAKILFDYRSGDYYDSLCESSEFASSTTTDP